MQCCSAARTARAPAPRGSLPRSRWYGIAPSVSESSPRASSSSARASCSAARSSASQRVVRGAQPVIGAVGGDVVGGRLDAARHRRRGRRSGAARRSAGRPSPAHTTICRRAGSIRRSSVAIHSTSVGSASSTRSITSARRGPVGDRVAQQLGEPVRDALRARRRIEAGPLVGRRERGERLARAGHRRRAAPARR